MLKAEANMAARRKECSVRRRELDGEPKTKQCCSSYGLKGEVRAVRGFRFDSNDQRSRIEVLCISGDLTKFEYVSR